MATELLLTVDPRPGAEVAARLADDARRLTGLRPDTDAFLRLGAEVLASAAHNLAAQGPADAVLTLEVEPAGPDTDRLASAAGLHLGRELQQLRRPLPVGAEHERADLDVRPFRPGDDDEAWVGVNNRAFSWHPDQGGWTVDDLRARMEEPWFRTDGFLVHEDDRGAIDGFCWTKIHADHDPVLGEIYVIGVDPSAQGRGLGGPLTVAGLDRLAAQGVPVGMLYVEADNAPAQAVYRRLGFTVHHCRRWYATPPLHPPATS